MEVGMKLFKTLLVAAAILVNGSVFAMNQGSDYSIVGCMPDKCLQALVQEVVMNPELNQYNGDFLGMFLIKKEDGSLRVIEPCGYSYKLEDYRITKIQLESIKADKNESNFKLYALRNTGRLCKGNSLRELVKGKHILVTWFLRAPILFDFETLETDVLYKHTTSPSGEDVFKKVSLSKKQIDKAVRIMEHKNKSRL
jgi:hypothetical protein